MSELYRVRFVSKTGRRAKLDVEEVHPDAGGVPADRSFALMVLREGTRSGDALGDEVGFAVDAWSMAKPERWKGPPRRWRAKKKTRR